ncbi:MAG: type II toxin-antitoxin system RelE/ParE family toxin [Holosporaceae bacterium]|nr:type II toxin-antitoxin system RelE/ParE family toxin [Holosporaceae bacterium]
MKGYRRLRVANYRVIYEIKDNELVVLIIEIDVRSKVYKFGSRK